MHKASEFTGRVEPSAKQPDAPRKMEQRPNSSQPCCSRGHNENSTALALKGL